ncbi:MAG: MarR family transcriptional regulator [Hydrogenophaga sp.]|nr:MarR family transcriptional regulator [Hydrogenophaga sp.]
MTLHDLYQRPGFLLRRTHQISAAVFENACATVGLTPAQYGVLTVLASEPGLDQTRLARALAFDKVTVMRVLRGLEERGLVERRVSEHSRRQMAVALTPQGARLLQQAKEPAEQAYQRLLSPLTLPQRRQLITLLQTLTDGLADEARAPFVPLETVPEATPARTKPGQAARPARTRAPR